MNGWTLTFALSPSAWACSSSGLVLSALKAVSSIAAEALSLPDLLYSLGSTFMSSLPWASLRAKVGKEVEMGRIEEVMGTRGMVVRRAWRRRMEKELIVAVDGWSCVGVW